MALTENRIGPYEFISLSGQPKPPRQMVMIDDRAGVDGSEKVLFGNKGEPFQLISSVDAESYETAKGFLDAYLSLISEDAVEMVQGGVSSETNGYRVMVTNVTAVDIRTLQGVSGNYLNPPSQGFIVAAWELTAVPFDEE